MGGARRWSGLVAAAALVGAAAHAQPRAGTHAPEVPPSPERGAADAEPPAGGPGPAPEAPAALHAPPARVVVQLRLYYPDGYGLARGDEHAEALLAAIEARRLELAACGPRSPDAGRELPLELLVAATGLIESVRPLGEPSVSEAVVTCVRRTLRSIDLRRGSDPRLSYWLYLYFASGPLPSAWAYARNPDGAPPRRGALPPPLRR